MAPKGAVCLHLKSVKPKDYKKWGYSLNKMTPLSTVVSYWYESNLLKGNYEKYQIISMGPKGKTKDLEITMSNVRIKCGSDLKLLGLTIHVDQNLDFSKHVSEVCKRAGRKVGVLIRLHNILSARAKLIRHSSLRYCLS